ncbi:adenylate cyclase [Marinobacter salinus]|uniref:Adenylate cyclase n=1 Tax=Marinobacter salinus TaxID=1874317 RepID=A0A1D9GRL7_9GAMM|nr:CYTH domain-containing protein [Marinobacter salinus]AOY90268.1 adenylate cyclase [Marinobacter salinus]
MAEELEIKLTLTREGLVRAHEWLEAQSEAVRGPQKSLLNRYYDTPESELNSQRAALRVRQAGDRCVQTLKTQGEFVGGAHRREEWEWPVPGTDLNLGLLADTPLGDGINLARLQPVFETNFTRQIIMLRQGDTEIEVALDQGAIVSGDSSRPLSEVEFELKSGDPSALITWAGRLAGQVPVFLNLVSKAEQGYYLAGLYTPDARHPGSPGPVSATDFLYGLSVSWLTGQPYAVSDLDLSDVARLAEQGGFGDLYSDIIASLGAGVSVATLMEQQALGKLQILLATS